jgi:Mg-chelatase subunit ChlD
MIDGVDVWFFSNPSANHPHFENIRTPEQVNALFARQNTGGTTDLAGALEQVFRKYFARGGSETILVITDGEPNNKQAVQAAIRSAGMPMTNE